MHFYQACRKNLSQYMYDKNALNYNYNSKA